MLKISTIFFAITLAHKLALISGCEKLIFWNYGDDDKQVSADRDFLEFGVIYYIYGYSQLDESLESDRLYVREKRIESPFKITDFISKGELKVLFNGKSSLTFQKNEYEMQPVYSGNLVIYVNSTSLDERMLLFHSCKASKRHEIISSNEQKVLWIEGLKFSNSISYGPIFARHYEVNNFYIPRLKYGNSLETCKRFSDYLMDCKKDPSEAEQILVYVGIGGAVLSAFGILILMAWMYVKTNINFGNWWINYW